MINKIKNLFIDEEGQGVAEYGVILGTISICIVLALVALRIQILESITTLTNVVSDTATAVVPPAH
jgi:pilus assembly protein Flp/PilA